MKSAVNIYQSWQIRDEKAVSLELLVDHFDQENLGNHNYRVPNIKVLL